ncbi:MAG: hypothetical protein Q7S51_02640 [Gallionellaceae bacterium]|nr:hypothetical protein [Gallionellaceae bacterium]
MTEEKAELEQPWKLVAADMSRKHQLREVNGMCTAIAMWLERGTVAVMVYRLGRYARQMRLPVISQLLKGFHYVLFYFVQMFSGISIQAYTRIGQGFVVNNFSGIFVLAESIGENFTVCEGVTVGNIRGKSRLPIIGNNVYLEPGCKVLGDVTIGDNVVVRANSLVLSAVPDNSLVVGNPARILPLTAAG